MLDNNTHYWYKVAATAAAHYDNKCKNSSSSSSSSSSNVSTSSSSIRLLLWIRFVCFLTSNNLIHSWPYSVSLIKLTEVLTEITIIKLNYNSIASVYLNIAHYIGRLFEWAGNVSSKWHRHGFFIFNNKCKRCFLVICLVASSIHAIICG